MSDRPGNDGPKALPQPAHIAPNPELERLEAERKRSEEEQRQLLAERTALIEEISRYDAEIQRTARLLGKMRWARYRPLIKGCAGGGLGGGIAFLVVRFIRGT